MLIMYPPALKYQLYISVHNSSIVGHFMLLSHLQSWHGCSLYSHPSVQPSRCQLHVQLQIGWFSNIYWILLSYFVSHGRKSVLLFTSGKRKAQVLMTSVGFGVTWLRTCWYKQKVSGNSYYSHPVLLVPNKEQMLLCTPKFWSWHLITVPHFNCLF